MRPGSLDVATAGALVAWAVLRRRPRPAPRVYLTAAHPKMTEGSDYFVGTSLDQLYAQHFGQDTPLPSIQTCIEMVDASGACDYGYACVYADTISWATPTTAGCTSSPK